MKITRLAVIGAGTMGRGIAQVAASAGLTVVLVDVDDEVVNEGIERVGDDLQKLVDRERMETVVRGEILGRIQGMTDLSEAVRRAHLLVEAVTEDLSIKKALFSKVEAACPDDTILATNTSALSVSEIASVLRLPRRMIGFHFFNPAPVMKLVELVRGVHTAEETLEAARALAVRLGKVPVEVKEMPGFIVNRILIPSINEAAFLVMEGVATKESIDDAMKLGANHPIGPLALADLVGIDVCVHIMETLHEEFGDSKYRVCPLLKQMVRGGLLGRKAGAGFYSYEGR